jgi:integrase/recombinase XerD
VITIMRLADAAEEYMASLGAERGLSFNTLSAYRRDLSQYLRFLDGAPARPDLLDSYVSWLRSEGMAPATVARKMAVVRGFHRFGWAEGLIDTDPTRLLEPPRRPDPFPKALTIEEVFRLIEAPDQNTAPGRRDRALLEFLYATGARVSEAIDLDLSALELEEHIVVITGKGDRQRLVPLGTKAISAIEAWLPDRLRLRRPGPHSEAVFLNLRGGRLSRQSAFRMVRSQAARVGIPPESVSPHTLRHSAATHMVEAGADLRTVQELLGHARISTTQVYTRVSSRHLLEIYLESHPRSK